MNSFTSANGLPFMTHYKRDKESRINVLINNLKINDVRDDTAFEKTTARIKHELLIQPVVFGQPKYIDHTFEDVPLTMQQQVLGGISRNHYTHEIAFPFSGDSELFSHIPESGFSFGAHDRGLILPYGNVINVEVDIPELNPDRAINEARNLLSMTFQFVNANNASLQAWTPMIENRIDEQLRQKRTELISIFGHKQ